MIKSEMSEKRNLAPESAVEDPGYTTYSFWMAAPPPSEDTEQLRKLVESMTLSCEALPKKKELCPECGAERQRVRGPFSPFVECQECKWVESFLKTQSKAK